MNQNKNIAVTPNSIVTEICKGVEKLKREEVFKNFPHQESLDNVYRNIFSNYYEDWNYKFIIDRGPWGCPPNLKFLKDYFETEIPPYLEKTWEWTKWGFNALKTIADWGFKKVSNFADAFPGLIEALKIKLVSTIDKLKFELSIRESFNFSF